VFSQTAGGAADGPRGENWADPRNFSLDSFFRAPKRLAEPSFSLLGDRRRGKRAIRSEPTRAEVPPMRLWNEEIEAMRAEARRAVAAVFPAMQEMLAPAGELPDAPVARALRIREQFAKTYAPVSEAVERKIAGVRCRVFMPERPARAVYLHFHGGGMILGAPEMNDPANLELSRRFEIAVVSVDYRLAPEHPYPAGPDDGTAVAAWLLEHAEREFGSSRLLVGGESAGGYMAAAVLLRARDELEAAGRIIGANLVFGVYDWGRSASQRGTRPHEGPDLLDPDGIRLFSDCYLPERSDDERRDPAISPAFADLRGLPPALLSVGTCDHLLDDTLLFASRSAAAGNEIELFVAPDLPHGFGFVPCGITTQWQERTARWFEEILAR
jgi:acetyl esterase/lipase